MYERHFGLARRLFPDRVAGSDVFVGPKTATAMATLKKALKRPDAIVAVTGPAGSGKSALVTKSLEALRPTYKVFRLGRMHLSDADVLAFLLEALGVPKLPNGAVRQFALFRRVLAAVEAQEMRVVVVVEDAARLGLDTLAELEAMTAADGGPSDGANIVLMGNESLPQLLQDPQLARVTQRTRHRHTVEPMRSAELRGYLMHSFRQAGGDLDAALTADAVDTLHALSGGIPRVANNVLEAAMTAAAEAGDTRIDGPFLAAVGSEEFGLDAPVARAPAAEFEPEPEPESEPQPEPEPELIVESGPAVPQDAVAEPAPQAEPEPEPKPEPEPEPEPVIVFSDEPISDDEIPELIQDTMPDLEVLAPEVVAAADENAFESGPGDDALPTLEIDPQELPELEPIAEVEPEPEPLVTAAPEPPVAPEDAPVADSGSSARTVPDWERDPTLAELRPDLDALEKAMALAHGESGEGERPKVVDVDTKPAPADPEPEEIPEITLDHAIQERIENNLIDEPGEISPAPQKSSGKDADTGDLPEVRLTPRKAKSSKMADAEIERIAAELAKAKTIEDVDDKLAETLFGEEINLIAAQIIANAPEAEPANDEELQLFDTGTVQRTQTAGTEPVADVPPIADAPPVEVSLETPEHGAEGGLDLSASQRLKTVRALNADLHPSLREPGNGPDPGPDVPARDIATPEPIEDQINTSMTQTLKALNVHPPTLDRDRDDASDEEDAKKGGFFSRFRRN